MASQPEKTLLQHREQDDLHIARGTECGKVGLHADRYEEEGDQQAVTDALKAVDQRTAVTEFGFHQAGEGKSGDEGANHQIDAEKFSDQHRGEDDQQQNGDEHVFPGLKVFQQFSPDAVHNDDCRKEVDQHQQQEERCEKRSEHGRINVIEDRQRAPGPLGRNADALPLELDAYGKQNDAGNVGDHRRNQHGGAEFGPGQFELPDDREDDSDRVGGEKRGVEQFAGEVFRPEPGVNRVSGNRRQQKGEHTECHHRFFCRGNQFEIGLHAGKRHQQHQTERAEGVNQGFEMRGHHRR